MAGGLARQGQLCYNRKNMKRIRSQEAKISSLENRIASHSETIKKQKETIKKQEKLIKEMQNSNSWKLTEPLRKIRKR